MRRCVSLVGVLLFLVACAPTTTTPVPTADIRRSKLDISYTAIADNDVHKVQSSKLLTTALEALKAEARNSGGTDNVQVPTDFSTAQEPVLADFKRFAELAAQLAAKNPQLSPDRIADTAINAMVRATPDCHTYYAPKGRSQAPSLVAAALPGEGGSFHDDEAGLEFRMLPGNVGYVAWREFVKTGTYDISAEVHKALDKLVTQGAKAWLFDLRGNIGGDPPQLMQSWFLNGEPMYDIQTRTGSAGIVTAKKDLRLPNEYQLPIAIVLNGRGGSSPEVLTLGLKENKRATVVGQKSVGCLGSINLLNLPDGSFLGVANQEFIGAVTGARYNNVGIPPDIAADDATAVDVAAAFLRAQIAKTKSP